MARVGKEYLLSRRYQPPQPVTTQYQQRQQAYDPSYLAAIRVLDRYVTEDFRTGDKVYNILNAVRDGVSRQTLKDAQISEKTIEWLFENKDKLISDEELARLYLPRASITSAGSLRDIEKAEKKQGIKYGSLEWHIHETERKEAIRKEQKQRTLKAREQRAEAKEVAYKGLTKEERKKLRQSGFFKQEDWEDLSKPEIREARKLVLEGLTAEKALEEIAKPPTPSPESHIQLPDGNWIPLKGDVKAGTLGWEDIPEKYQKIGKKWGYDNMMTSWEADTRYQMKQQEKITAEFEAKHLIINNEAMLVEDWNKLPPKYQSIAIQENSFSEMEKALKADLALLEPFKVLAPFEYYKELEQYNVDDALASKNPKVIAAVNALFPSVAKVIVPPIESKDWIYQGQRITESERQKIVSDFEAKRDKLIREGKMFTDEWFNLGMNPLDTMTRTPESAARVTKQAAIVAAEVIVPGLYLAKHWEDLSPAEKGLFIAIDIASIIPFAAAATRGAKTVGTAGRIARLAAAGKEVGREALVTVRAPINMIIHPIATTKATAKQLRTLAENIAHPKKIPEAVITTSDGIVMLRVGKDTTAKEALEFQKKLAELTHEGQTIIVKLGKTEIELTRSPLMREAKGLVHVTPDIEPLLKATKVHGKVGVPLSEQGLFLTHEPAIQFTTHSAFGKNMIPVPKEATEAVIKTGKYRAADLVKMDAPVLRPFNLADAKNIPVELASKLKAYIKKVNARVYGSFNEWLKNPKAARPNDIDIAVENPQKVLDDILRLAKEEGFQARRVKHAIEIFTEGQWKKVVDVDSISRHKTLIPLSQPARQVEGIRVETLGEQYLRQSYGAITKTEKASERAKRLAKAAKLVEQRLKAMGATIMQAGIVIYSPKTAEKAIATGKLFKAKGIGLTAEAEAKFAVRETLPEIKQTLFTRVGTTGERVIIGLEKPLAARQIIKLKALGLVEWIKTPFKPPIKVRRIGKASIGLTSSETDELAKLLKESGNIDQARNLVRVENAARIARVAPPTINRVTGLKRLPTRRITRLPRRLIPRAIAIPRVTRVPRVGEPLRTSLQITTRKPPIRRRPPTITRRPPIITTIRRPPRKPPERPPTRVPPRVPPPRIPPRRPPPELPPRRPPKPPFPTITAEVAPKKMTGAVAWRQGALKRKGKIIGIWKVWTPPYTQETLKTYWGDELPPGVKKLKGTPSKTVQLYEGTKPPPEAKVADIGAFLATIKAPTSSPGKAGAIGFRRDIEQIRSSKLKHKRKHKRDGSKSRPVLAGIRA